MRMTRLWTLLAALALVAGSLALASCGDDDSGGGGSEPTIELATTIPTGELYGLAIPKDNPSLLAAVNGQLTAMKEDGTLDELYQKYFGVDAPPAVINKATGTGGGGEPETQEPGKLLVGSDIPYPPFEDGSDGNYTGFDIDLVTEIAKRLDLEVTFQDTSFDTIFNDLASGSFDMVASASTITPERQKVVSFSDPYYSADQAIVVVPGSDIKSVEDLAGKNVAAQNGTTGLTYAQDETDAANVQGFPQGPDVINAVKAGQVDAGILDLPVAQDAIKKAG